jgi:hypothetical protein
MNGPEIARGLCKCHVFSSFENTLISLPSGKSGKVRLVVELPRHILCLGREVFEVSPFKLSLYILERDSANDCKD